jgi:hypothetical protein
MGYIISVAILILAIIWAVRIETGINKMNETLQRIEKKLGSKEKK